MCVLTNKVEQHNMLLPPGLACDSITVLPSVLRLVRDALPCMLLQLRLESKPNSSLYELVVLTKAENEGESILCLVH